MSRNLHPENISLITINDAPDRYTCYVRNYVGKNCASFGYYSLGGDRLDTYGAGHPELIFITNDGSYVDISDDNILKQYFVTSQSLEPNTEIKYVFQTDSSGKEYDNLIQSSSISQIELHVSKIGDSVEPDSDPIISETEVNVTEPETQSSISDIDLTSKDTIKAVQEALNNKGYDCGVPDGVIGSKTNEAIISYKSQNGLSGKEEITVELVEHLGITNTAITNDFNDSNQTEDFPSGLSPEFKAAMDSYEEFFDEYVQLMQDYSDNPTDMGLLTKYAEFMTKYDQYMEDFEAIEGSDMTDEESKYYIEVSLRIEQKLLSVL